MNMGKVDKKVEASMEVLDKEFCKKCIYPETCKNGYWCYIKAMKDMCPKMDKNFFVNESN